MTQPRSKSALHNWVRLLFVDALSSYRNTSRLVPPPAPHDDDDAQ